MRRRLQRRFLSVRIVALSHEVCITRRSQGEYQFILGQNALAQFFILPAVLSMCNEETMGEAVT